MNYLPHFSHLYTREQAYALDAAAIKSGISASELMNRAAEAAAELIIEQFGPDQLVTIYTGSGNNAGDGFMLAALLKEQGSPVKIISVVPPAQLKGLAVDTHAYARAMGVEITAFEEMPTSGILVDALLGIGGQGPLRAEIAAAVEQINAAELPVVALDVPTGIDATTGAVASVAIKATITLSFLGLKSGLVTGRAPALVGKLLVDSLDVNAEVLTNSAHFGCVVNLAALLDTLPLRAKDSHKGNFGRVLVIGGERGFGGAALLAAEAAARVGAGTVSIATRPEHVAAILARRPEIMATGVVSGQELEPWLERPTHLILGPGLGQTPWSEQMLQQAINTDKPLVIDADALNILAEGRVVKNPNGQGRWLLTPHPAEAARLLGITTQEVQADRYTAARMIAERYHAAVILKGAGSIVVVDEASSVVIEGNAGMATGGMGDVLSGILGGLWAQGLPLSVVVPLGASLHAAAADLAAEEWGQRSLLAADIIPYVCELLASAEA